MSIPLNRVLIVEDEVILALDFSDTIAELGYEVVGPALTLSQGLDLAASEHVDCALLDVNLGGGMTSQQIAESLRARNVRLAFVTAYNRDNVDFAQEDEEILRKPPSQATLMQLLAALCS